MFQVGFILAIVTGRGRIVEGPGIGDAIFSRYSLPNWPSNIEFEGGLVAHRPMYTHIHSCPLRHSCHDVSVPRRNPQHAQSKGARLTKESTEKAHVFVAYRTPSTGTRFTQIGGTKA